MEYIVQYPEQNPLQMLPEQVLPPDIYRGRGYAEWWLTEQLKPWQGTRRFYNQKYQQSDPITLQWHSNSSEVATLQIVTQCGEVAYETNISSTSITGFKVTGQISGTEYDGYTYIFNKIFSTLELEDGIYYVIIRSKFDNPDDPFADAGGMVTTVCLSEPILLREEHKHTLFFHYKNSVNDFDVFYLTAGINFQFGIRCEAWLHNHTAHSIDTTYEDEQVDVTLLQSIPYNTEVLGLRKVPFWIKDKMNRAFSHDLLRIDSATTYYTKDKDAQWDVNYGPNRALNSYAITVRKARNYFSKQMQVNSAFVVWEVDNNGDGLDGTRFPYFVKSARLNRSSGGPVHLMVGINGATGIGYSTYCKEVRNTADEQILLNHANNETRSDYSQLGYYSIMTTSGGGVKFIYTPHASESNYTGSTSVVLTQHWENNFNNSWLTGHWFDIKGSQIGYAFVNQAGVHKSLAYGNGNPNIFYTVGSNGIFLDGNTSRVYHHEQSGGGTDTITEFKNVTGTVPNLVSIDKRLPEALITFMSRYSTAMTEFNAAVLAPCMANIFLLDLYLNPALASVTANTWSITFGGQQLQDLKIIDMSRCDFTSASVDDILNEIYNGGGGAQTIVQNMGDLYIDLQTPAAPPTAASAAAITYLTGTKLWSVQTD